MGYPLRVSRACPESSTLSEVEGRTRRKVGPLEAGRVMHYPPSDPERVTSKALKRKEEGFHDCMGTPLVFSHMVSYKT